MRYNVTYQVKVSGIHSYHCSVGLVLKVLCLLAVLHWPDSLPTRILRVTVLDRSADTEYSMALNDAVPGTA